jgi:hypothetical protein
MKNKSSLYIGIMVLTLGALFLVMNIGSTLLGSRSVLSISRLWPLIVIWVSFGFFLPIFIWWGSRHKNYGLAMPGTIILVNGLLFLYSSLSGDWRSWAYLWTLEPFSVALGLLALYYLGSRAQGLLIAAMAIGGASLAVFAILVSATGGIVGGVIGAFLLIALGVILVARAFMQRQ